MSDIFISYSRRDKSWVDMLAKALEEQGYDVWWDPEILPGQDFEEIIKASLNATRCVVTVWSKESVKSHWVKEESSRALTRRILVPLLYQAVEPPMPFGRIQTANLVGWKGKETDPRFQQLLRAIALHCEPSIKSAPEAEPEPVPIPEPVSQQPQTLRPQFPEPVIARVQPELPDSGEASPPAKNSSFFITGFFAAAIMLTTGAFYANWDRLFGNISPPSVETPVPPPPLPKAEPKKPELAMKQVRECLKGKDETCWKPSLDWLEKQANTDDMEAMYLMGSVNYLGLAGVAQNTEVGCDWLKRSEKAGYEKAKEHLKMAECN